MLSKLSTFFIIFKFCTHVSPTDGTDLSDTRYCGLQHSDDYLHASEDFNISIDEFPWLAMLLYRNQSDSHNSSLVSVCSGALINDKYILTAAQCLKVPGFELVGVRLGEYDTRTKKDCINREPQLDCAETTDFGIKKSISHEDYKRKTGINDIALLELNKTIFEYADSMRPICLPIDSMPPAQPGDILFTSGWGSTKYDSNMAFIKKKVHTKCISNDECVKIYETSRRAVTKDHLCTEDLHNNVEFSCRGDAGAPVMFENNHQWHIEGISSGGGECGGQLPEVYTRVRSYIPWISKHIK